GECYDDRITRIAAYIDDLKRMETCHGAIFLLIQRHLKYSNGSRQSRQRYAALHGVEPNWLSFSVFVESQRGQVIAGRASPASRAAMRPLAAVPSTGGAMPKALSLCRASLLIQSVVQGGESRCSMR